MNRKLLQQSLDALNLIFRSTPPYKENGECTLTDAASKLCCETIDALEAELAKPEQEQEQEQEYDHASDAMSILADINVDLIQDANPEQKPVAWMYDWYGHKSQSETKALVKDWIATIYSEVSDPTIGAHNIRPLYTSPPRKEWVGLTGDEIKDILNCGRGGLVDIKKVEQLLKDKNK